MDSESTKDVLIRHKEGILRKLVGLAADGRPPSESHAYRLKADALLADLAITEEMLSGIPRDGQRFDKFDRPQEAILAYLDWVKRPATDAEIETALISGGFVARNLKGEEVKNGTVSAIRKSISGMFTGKASVHNYIKRVNNLLGRTSWEDSLFFSDSAAK